MYEVFETEEVAFNVVVLNIFARVAHVVVDLVAESPVTFAGTTGVFPKVGQADAPVKLFAYNGGLTTTRF